MDLSVSIVSLGGAQILDVPEVAPARIHRAVAEHFDNLLEFTLLWGTTDLMDATGDVPDGTILQMKVNHRKGIYRIIMQMRIMKGSENIHWILDKVADDVDEFIKLSAQEVYAMLGQGAGYIETARVILVWERLQCIPFPASLCNADVEAISESCASIDRHEALRKLITMHNDRKLSVNVRRYKRVCREVAMELQ